MGDRPSGGGELRRSVNNKKAKSNQWLRFFVYGSEKAAVQNEKGFPRGTT